MSHLLYFVLYVFCDKVITMLVLQNTGLALVFVPVIVLFTVNCFVMANFGKIHPYKETQNITSGNICNHRLQKKQDIVFQPSYKDVNSFSVFFLIIFQVIYYD